MISKVRAIGSWQSTEVVDVCLNAVTAIDFLT
jgi:hypothetical protein